MTDKRKSDHLFADRGLSFVSIIANGKLGGRKAMTDYLQMRSSQLVRQMRRMNGRDEDVSRVRRALLAMSEASRFIKTASITDEETGSQKAAAK